MDGNEELAPVDLHLAWVRASGRVYAQHARQAGTALVILRAKLGDAYDAGANITQLAAASGLSRNAVYRAVQDVD